MSIRAIRETPCILVSAVTDICVIGGTVRFETPEYRLPVSGQQVREMLLCADYRTKNLTHASRSFGVGAPLVIDIDKPVKEGEAGFAKKIIITVNYLVQNSVVLHMLQVQ